jgi:hypothetical protein
VTGFEAQRVSPTELVGVKNSNLELRLTPTACEGAL